MDEPKEAPKRTFFGILHGPSGSVISILGISMLGAAVALVGIRLIGNATSDGAFAPLYGPGYDELQPVAPSAGQ